MRFRVLGPIEAWDGEAPLPLGGPKPRLLFAVLLAEHDRVHSTERLVDILWGEDPPETGRALIHTYVSALRRALNRPGTDEVIMTRPPGYLLRLGQHELDSERFERLVADGRDAARSGEPDRAAEVLRAAEALWRGPAYEAMSGPVLATEAARLEELRLAAIEERVAVELTLGREEDLVGELTSLVRAHPTRERLRARLMVALYRLGRQADALAVYRRGREELVDELGIDPGPELQRTHELILRCDPSLLAPTAVPNGASPRPVRSGRRRPRPQGGAPAPTDAPAQLPGVPADFTGRAAEIAALVARLCPDATDATAADGWHSGATVCVIAGEGGAGKSTLALRVGHEVSAGFPDGQLYADLRGTSENPAQPAEVLGRFLRALGTDPATVPETLEERAERWRTLLARRRTLVVLDDAHDERTVRPLLPGGAGNAVIVTARRRLPGLAGATHLDLDVLDPAEAVTLLARIAGEDRAAAEADAATQIVRQCGCLPLAVRIVGARLASRPHWTLQAMARRLADEQRRLDELAIADQQVRASIEITYESLDPQAQAALRALGTLSLPDFPAWVVSTLLDVSTEDGEDVVERLVDAHVADFARTDPLGLPRYRIHELVRVYARERADQTDARADRDQSVRRLMLAWVWLVERISADAPTGTIPWHHEAPQPAPPATSVVTLVLDQPRVWLDAEQEVLVVAVERASALDLADVSVALATALCGSAFAVGNLFESWGRTHAAALTAARRAKDRRAEAMLLAQLGQLRCDQDRYAESHEYLLDALTIFRELGDQRGEATVLAAIGSTCREQGRLAESLHFLRQAQQHFQATRFDPGLGFTGRLVGATRLEQGDFAQAQADLLEAVEAYRRFGCRRGEALTIRTLSLIHRATGRLDQALALALEAAGILRSLGDELLQAYAAQSVAKTLIRMGRWSEAAGMVTGALQVCQRLGDQWGEAFMLRTCGELNLAAGRLAEAEADLSESVRRWTALDVPLQRARSLRDLADVREAQGDPEVAASLRAIAVEIFRALGAREAGEMAAAGPVYREAKGRLEAELGSSRDALSDRAALRRAGDPRARGRVRRGPARSS